jgi:transaldolase
MTDRTRLHELLELGQSPWLDNLRRGWITSGELAAWIERGIRGLTSNPSIFQKAISAGTDYDEQFGELVGAGASVTDAYWDLVTSDIRGALELLRPTYDRSDGVDGYVSVEVAPDLARDSAGTEAAARHLHATIDAPNLYVKIPGTAEGIAPIRTMIAEGRSINVTLIFSLDRYAEVMEAYLSGLEQAEGDLSRISSVASFFISRVDTEVDRRLEAIGTDAALALRGTAAVAQAQMAYAHFQQTFAGPRWDALVARGARVQRPLWASTSTKNPADPDTRYVDSLIGPHTVTTLTEPTIDAFQNHGHLADTLGGRVSSAAETMTRLATGGIDMDDVGRVLELQGIAAFEDSFAHVLDALDAKAHRRAA